MLISTRPARDAMWHEKRHTMGGLTWHFNIWEISEHCTAEKIKDESVLVLTVLIKQPFKNSVREGLSLYLATLCRIL